MTERRWLSWIAESLPLGVVLLLAVELRLLFRSGVGEIDTLTTAHWARNLADGIWSWSDLFPRSSSSVWLYGPVAVVYRAFGSTDATTIAWPLACSLLGVAGAYAIGRTLAGEGAGLFAALVWAVLPAAIATATVLSGEGPMAALSMGIVLLIIRAARRRWPSWLIWLLVAAGVVAGVLFVRRTTSALGSLTAGWLQATVGSLAYAWIAPLWIVATATLLALRPRQASVIVLWFSSVFLFLEFSASRHSLLMAAPLGIAAGIYLAQNVRPAVSRWIAGVATGVIGLVAWVGARYTTDVDWPATRQADLPFATASGLATAVAVFGAMASPLVVSGSPSRWKTLALALLIAALGIAPLAAAYRGSTSSRRPWMATFAEAARFLEHDPKSPILVPETEFGQRLDYVSHFELGFNSVLRHVGTRARIQLAPRDPVNIRNAYVLVDEAYVRESAAAGRLEGAAYLSHPPAAWAEVARFGDREGYRLHVYRAPSDNAAGQLQAARSALDGSRSPQTLQDWLVAATGAGEFCEAAAAWQALRASAGSRARVIDPLPVAKECVAQRPDVRGPNLFRNGDFTRQLDAWSTSPDVQAAVSVERADRMTPTWHVVYRAGNGLVITQLVVLQPDAVYIYEADIKTTAPAIALLWSAGNREPLRFLDASHLYPEWTHVTYVFLTPHWDGQSSRADFSPVVMKGVGEAWLRNVRLSEFRPPTSE